MVQLNYRIKVEEPSSSQSNWEMGISNAVITYIVPGDEVEEAISTILGYSYRLGNELKRNIPHAHPQYYWLYASRIGIQGDVFSSKRQGANGLYDDFDEYWLTTHYQTQPYDIWDDNVNLNGEWERWVEKIPEPYTDIINIQGARWKFSSGEGNPSGEATLGNNVGLRVFRAQETVHWRWYAVPEPWIFTSDLIATNIRAALNTMNDDTFAGYTARTLLLHAVKYVPVYAPVHPARVTSFGVNTPRQWNVELTFLYDPNGWHTSIDYLDRNFYQIETLPEGPYAGGDLLYEETDFANIFAGV